MITTTLNHEFAVGDKAHSLFLKEGVEILDIKFTILTRLSTVVNYSILTNAGQRTIVAENDLIPISKPTSQPPTSSQGTYTLPTGGTFTYSGTVIGTAGTAGSVTFTLPQGFTLDPYAINDPDKEPAKCECGAEKVGSNNHSSWCDKHDSLGLGV